MGESADVEEIEFFSDSGARKAKLSALTAQDKKMRFIVRSPQGDGLQVLCSIQKFRFSIEETFLFLI